MNQLINMTRCIGAVPPKKHEYHFPFYPYEFLTPQVSYFYLYLEIFQSSIICQVIKQYLYPADNDQEQAGLSRATLEIYSRIFSESPL